ncbi:hypothetical protein DQ04_00361010 [Trypanosoma grayi]|uniref:hypothetical protein n=1 Tax=Trypanosoma grayi TaxID=71804 RepID=UPI0004F47867|nr:hypothetical protein DQ04_00361010 [Trypanosoma grayi]KEG14639.1 hypothetical protein DQ04_00361010 [Trypanosoma grayi]
MPPLRLGARLIGPRNGLAACAFTLRESRRFQATVSNAELSRRVAQALFSMERFHRGSPSEEERRQVERQAWQELLQFPDSAAEDATASEVADILGAWCYFSRFWTHGMQGLGDEELAGDGGEGAGKRKDVAVPLVDRQAVTAAPPSADLAPPPRPNPLDEVLEF